MICKHCGKENEDNSKFCQNCGVNLSDSFETKDNNFCPKCGAENDQMSKYCIVCGKALTQTKNHTVYTKDRSTQAKLSLIFGILSAVFGILCCCGVLYIPAILTGIASLILGIMSVKSEKKGNAIAGIVLGIIGILLGLFMLGVIMNEDQILEYIRVNYPELWEEIQETLKEQQIG